MKLPLVPFGRLRRPLSLILLTSAMAALGIAVGGCAKDETAGAAAPKQGQGPSAVVRIEPIVSRLLPPRVVVVGTVTARHTSVVASGAAGVVDRYDAEEGERVKEGTLLARLRLKSAQAELDQAQALLQQRKQEWEELKSTRPEEISEAEFRMNAAQFVWNATKRKHKQMQDAFRRKVVNVEDLDDAREREEQAHALYKAATSNYDRLKKGPREEKQLAAKHAYEAQQKRIEFLKAEFDKRTTLAPFDGFIVKEQSYVGQWVSKGDPVVTMARLDQVDVMVNVDQEDVRHIFLGKQADVRIQGVQLVSVKTQAGDVHQGLLVSESATNLVLAKTGGRQVEIDKSDIALRRPIPWTGNVVQIVPKSEWKTGSRGFPVKVRVRNRFLKVTVPPEKEEGKARERLQPVLKEGMMATVTFTGRPVAAFLVHKDALVRSTEGKKINLFRKADDFDKTRMGRTSQMRVKTGIAVGSLIQVIPDPANDGEPKTLGENMFVVNEGGERLRPVQGNVLAADKPVTAKD